MNCIHFLHLSNYLKFFRKLHHYILIISLSFSLSCAKKEVNSSEDLETKNRIVDSLNSQSPDSVLRIVNEKLISNPDDSELLFYKACALAMKGGIDLFKLYPMLKMKFFHEAIVNWDDLKKYENPYQKFFHMDFDRLRININKNIKKKIKTTISKLEDKIKNLTLKDIENYFTVYDKVNEKFLKGKYSLNEDKKDYLRKLAINYKDNRKLLKRLNKRFDEKLEIAKHDYEQYQEEYKKRIQSEIKNVYDEVSHINGLKIDQSESLLISNEKESHFTGKERPEDSSDSDEEILVHDNDESIDSLLDQIIELQAKTYKTTVAINNVVNNQETIENHPATPENDSNVDLNLKVVKDNAMKIIWGVYMALPLISLMPIVEDEKLNHIDEALEILNKVVDKNDDIFKKSQHYMSFLSAVSFLIVFKKTLMVDDVLDPLSFVCNFDYKAMFASYFRLHNYLNYFMKGAVGIKFSSKYFTKIADFTSKIENDQGDLSDDAKTVIKESLGKVKKEVCEVDPE